MNLGEKAKANLDANNSNHNGESGEEVYSERGIDIPGESKNNNSRYGSKKNKKTKQGQYVIDIEPLQNSDNDNIAWESEGKNIENRTEDKENKYNFIRGASGRSTMDGSCVSGSLDVHFHTGTAPSPISTGRVAINEKRNNGDRLEKSYLETELPVYEKD